MATPDIAKHFRMQPADIDAAMYDIEWINRPQSPQGKRDLTRKGKLFIRKEMSFRDGGLFVIWTPKILDSRLFSDAVEKYRDKSAAQSPSGVSEQSYNAEEFRRKHPANYRTNDGHRVRSEGERKIDDFLYAKGITHEYERALPVEDKALCDFYLPDGDVYIEYWGLDDPEYAAKRKWKEAIYKKHGLNLVGLVYDEVRNLGDNLPRKLRPYGIKI